MSTAGDRPLSLFPAAGTAKTHLLHDLGLQATLGCHCTIPRLLGLQQAGAGYSNVGVELHILLA